MAQPTDTPVISKIRAAAAYGLKNRIIAGTDIIRYTTAGNDVIFENGYFNTIRNVYSQIPKSFEQINAFPAVNLFISDNASIDSVNMQVMQNTGLLTCTCTLVCECFVVSSNDIALEIDKIRSDIMNYFGANYFIPDSTGAATAQQCYYRSDTVYGIDSVKPSAYISINFAVWYRARLNNSFLSY